MQGGHLATQVAHKAVVLVLCGLGGLELVTQALHVLVRRLARLCVALEVALELLEARLDARMLLLRPGPRLLEVTRAFVVEQLLGAMSV